MICSESDGANLNIIFSIKHYYGNYFYLLILQLYVINSNRNC